MASWTCVQCVMKVYFWFGIADCGVVWTEGTAHRNLRSEPDRRNTLDISRLTLMVEHHKNTISQILKYDSVSYTISQYKIEYTMHKHIIKSPLGTHTTTVAKAQEIAEIFPRSSEIASNEHHPPTFQSLIQTHPNVYRFDWHFWRGSGTMNSYWLRTRDFERYLGPFDYIGPNLLSGRMTFEEVVEQILRHPDTPHLISPSHHETWQSWHQNKAIYEEVRKRTDKKLIPGDFASKHRTIPKFDRQELRRAQNWDALCSVELSGMSNSPFGSHDNIFRTLHAISTTIVTAPRDNHRWTVGGPSDPYELQYRIHTFSTTISNRTVLPVLKALSAHIADELQKQGQFHFPNIGKLKLKRTANKWFIGISGTVMLRNYLNDTSIDIPGEKSPMEGVKYWFYRSQPHSKNFYTLSRQRQLSAIIKDKTNLSLSQVHGCLCFIQRVLYAGLRQNEKCILPKVGVFSTSKRKGATVLRFDADHSIRFWKS